jgi:hypothetical protein
VKPFNLLKFFRFSMLKEKDQGFNIILIFLFKPSPIVHMHFSDTYQYHLYDLSTIIIILSLSLFFLSLSLYSNSCSSAFYSSGVGSNHNHFNRHFFSSIFFACHISTYIYIYRCVFFHKCCHIEYFLKLICQ